MKKILFPLILFFAITSCRKEKVCECLVKYDPPLQDTHGSKRMKGTSSSLNSQCNKFGEEMQKEYPNGNRVDCTLR